MSKIMNSVKKLQHELAKFIFSKTYPEHTFSHLYRRKFEVILVMNIPKGSLRRIKELDLHVNNPSDEVNKRQEVYAKTALLIFYLCRKR